MLDMHTQAAFQVRHSESNTPYMFIAAEHKLLAISIFKRDGIRFVCQLAIRDGATNLPVDYTFDFFSEDDAECAMCALNAAAEPEE